MRRLSRFSRVQLAQTLLLAAGFALALAAQGRSEAAQRIVSVGGSVTEIVYALDQQHRLAARDTTSVYPEAALALPDVGYVRRLSPEGVLSVQPDLILAEEGAGPPVTLALLQESEIPVVQIPMGFDRAAVLAKITAVAEALGVPERGAVLAARTGAGIDAALAEASGLAGKRVLFVLSAQGGRIIAAGSGTAAEGIIRMAGSQNAVQGFEGYKPLTDEALLQAAPEVILLMDRRGPMAVSDEDLFANPALAATPAGQARTVLRMEPLQLLGFSVRTGKAIRALAAQLARAGS